MTRSISATNEAASAAAVVAPVLFAKLEFDSGDVLAHTGLGDITWGGDTYLGVGTFGGVSAVSEDTELARNTLELSLSGIPGTMLAIVLSEYYQGNTATLYLGFLNTTTMQLLDDPFVVFKGRIDTAKINQGEQLAVTLTVESRFAAWDKPLSRRYNDGDQQTRYPGDLGLQFVEQIVDKQIHWGQKTP